MSENQRNKAVPNRILQRNMSADAWWVLVLLIYQQGYLDIPDKPDTDLRISSMYFREKDTTALSLTNQAGVTTRLQAVEEL